MEQLIQKAADAMVKRGFIVHRVPGAQEARELVLSLIPQGASVGLGGSMTIRELNLVEALEERGSQVWWHWTSPEERLTVYENARKADVYLASSNAVTRDGRIVNIDGQANRVAGMIQGPSRVILAVPPRLSGVPKPANALAAHRDRKAWSGNHLRRCRDRQFCLRVNRAR